LSAGSAFADYLRTFGQLELPGRRQVHAQRRRQRAGSLLVVSRPLDRTKRPRHSTWSRPSASRSRSCS